MGDKERGTGPAHAKPARVVGADAASRKPAATGITLQQSIGNRSVRLLHDRIDNDDSGSDPAARQSLLQLALDGMTGVLLSELSDKPQRFPAGARLMDPELDTAVGRLLSALVPLAESPAAQAVWPAVVRQVGGPAIGLALASKAKDERASAVSAAPALFDEQVVSAINALNVLPPGTKDGPELIARRKAEVLARVFSALLSVREESLAPGKKGLDVEPTNLQRELDSLPEVKPFIGEKEQDPLPIYSELRVGLLAEFGALKDGTAAALERMRKYYGRIVKFTFLGKEIKVHPLLKASLERAEAALSVTERNAFSQGVEIGTIAIRPNRNNALELSRHSFGRAIDIDPSSSPNIPNFPTALVEALTGSNVMVDKAGRKKGNIMDFGPVLDAGINRQEAVQAEAERLAQASQQFSSIFTAEKSLSAKLFELAHQRARPASDLTPSQLLTLVQSAASEGANVRWRVPVPPDAEVTLGGKRSRSGTLVPRGVHHEWLVQRLYAPRSGFFNPEPVQETVELLISLAVLFESTFQHEKSGERTVASGTAVRVPAVVSNPSLAVIAVHGFLGIEPRLIAVLSSPEIGNLRWLGGLEKKLKDSMHFELKGPPELY